MLLVQPSKNYFFFFSYNQRLRGHAKNKAKIPSRTGRPQLKSIIQPSVSHRFSIQIPNFVTKKFQLDSSFKKHIHQFLLNIHFYLRSMEVRNRHVQDILTPKFTKILLLSRCIRNFCCSCYKCTDISCFKIYNRYF